MRAERRTQGDADLLVENFSDYNLPIKETKGMPRAFDASDDYFRLVNAVNGESETKMVGVPQVIEQEPSVNPAASKNIGCMDVASHLDHCDECRKRLETIFRNIVSHDKQKIAQPEQRNPSNVTTDLVLLIVLGIFIVFVLDIFVRLGKFLKR